MELTSTFGERIRALMIANGYSVQDLADRCNVSPQLVRRWVKLKKPSVSAENLLNLSTALHARMLWLVAARGPLDTIGIVDCTPEGAKHLAEMMPADRLASWLTIGRFLCMKDQHQAEQIGELAEAQA